MRHLMIEARKTHSMTQAELGEMVGLSRQAISHIELGRRNGRTSTWQKLAALFKLSQEELQRQATPALSADGAQT